MQLKSNTSCDNYLFIGSVDRFVRLKGTISIKLSNDNHEYSFPISHETITIRGPLLGQTAMHEIPSMGAVHNTFRLLTPLFHYINSFTSFPGSNSRIYNIFSLTGGFANLVRFKFNITFEDLGTLLAEIRIKRAISDSDYFEGNMNIEVKNEGDFQVPTEAYSEKHFDDGTINYTKIARGVLRFQRQSVQYITIDKRPPKALHARIIGTAYVPVDKASCLLEDGSLVEDEKDIFRVRLGPKGYCNTICKHSSTFCTIYCLDYPTLESEKSCESSNK